MALRQVQTRDFFGLMYDDQKPGEYMPPVIYLKDSI